MIAESRIGAALAGLALALALASCDGDSEGNPVGLESVVVESRDLVSSVAATGTVEPIRVADVKSQASGEILEIAIELGQTVERGDLLVRIDPRDVRNAFEQAEADLEVAESRLAIAARQLERIRELHASDVVTDEEVESAELEFANARAAQVKARTNLELARDRLNDVVVRAPLRGTVVERNVEEGQIVTSTREVTGGTTLVRMADLGEVQVRMMADEGDIGKIEPGLPAEIRVEAYPEREFRGTVLQVEPQAVVEQNVTMFAVLTRIRNEGDLLKPGMNADVEVMVGRREGVPALPNGAIKSPDEARQLARVLDLEVPDPMESPRAQGGGATAGAELPDDLQRLRSMSQEERQEHMQDLSPAERRRLFQRFREVRETEAAATRSDPTRPRPAYVFQRDDRGRLALEPIVIGLSTWDYSEIVAGLEEGEEVVLVPQALIQQREMLERIRGRSGIPGMRRDDD